jgi:hypothetical protein
MYISFIDDAGTTGSNEKDEQCPFQIVGGPVIDSALYTDLRTEIVRIYADAIGFDFEGDSEWGAKWVDVEFHAHKMFHAKEGPYAEIGQESCRQFLQGALQLLADRNIPIIYGLLDKRSFRGTPLEGATNPVTLCCNLYFKALINWWLAGGSPPTGWSGGEPALLIADASEENKKSDFRKRLHGSFKTCLRQLQERDDWGISPALSLFDDIYFGDSRESIGLQLADISMYFIHRWANKHPESEGFYNILRPVIVEAVPFSLEGQVNAK